MARMKRGAKSQLVRDYIAENPQARPQDIVEGLRSKGFKIKLTLVRGIKYKKPSKPGKRRGPSVRAAARRSSGANLTVEQLIELKRLTDELGGAEQLRRALETLEQLR